LSRIFKSVSLRDTPHVVAYEPPKVIEPEPEPKELDGELEPEAAKEPDPADAVLNAANGEALGIIAAAREKAAAVVAAADEEAAKLRQKAYDEGFESGFAEGQARGEAAGLEQAKDAITAAAERAAKLLAMAQEQADEAFANAERQVVELALAVAGKILARQVVENPTVVLPIIKTALDRVQDQEQITIRVHPECFELVLAARPELQAGLARASTLNVAADAALKAGDCIIETPYGTVDARIDTQMELVKAALRELLP
jgi:flagellar assembly protein FliH